MWGPECFYLVYVLFRQLGFILCIEIVSRSLQFKTSLTLSYDIGTAEEY